MHGIIFASLYDYVRARTGRPGLQAVFDGRTYSMSEAHPDEELIGLLERTAAETGLARDELLRDFGAFTAQQTFARLYPAFFTIAGGTRPFLLTVEDRIHELIRATIPNAAPPALAVSAAGDDGVQIVYTSERRLCRLLEGLVVGTGLHYGETVTVAETECMHEGAAACRFDVVVEP